MNSRFTKPTGFSIGDRLVRNNGYHGAYAPPTPPLYEAPAKVCAPADRFDYNGHTYDRSLLVKIRGTLPIIYAAKDAEVSEVVVDDTVMRYDPVAQQGARSTPDLVFVDIHMKPVLAPTNYDGKPPKQVYLVSKHAFKKALVAS